jgi:AraC-like DNA-binding protein
MRKSKNPGIEYFYIPGATQAKVNDALYQRYDGDFFSIHLTQPADLALHNKKINAEEISLQYLNPSLIFEITFDESLIVEYKKICPELIDAKKLNALIPFWSLPMEHAKNQILQCPFTGGLADRYIYARIIDLMITFIDQVQHAKGYMDEEQIKYAEKAKQIIESDLSVYDSVEAVAKKAGISESDLQTAFKKRFGTTVGIFSRYTRMEFAHRMLEDSNEILLSVAISVGYNDPGNFSVAFKKYFGYSPGLIQKQRKNIILQKR